ncbi:MAG: hypothetical protein LC789_10215 [Actinobacteria bacterium]|nr:hypothetical protein [Actinomycetota bacterium]MCA1720806.1 hypothetical protein [Actinomycetota bacterium]
MRHRQQLAKGIALAGLCAALAGCVPQGLAFKVDDRVSFSSPKDRATVRLPLTLEWDVRDFDITAPGGEPRKDAGYFAVFVDSSPMPPGKKLAWIARKDNSCRPADGCPDAEYLAARNIYMTTNTKLVLEQLPRGNDEDRRERHRATIVLLDASGARIGESAFEIAFDIDRKATP